jgi:hypothetical protein
MKKTEPGIAIWKKAEAPKRYSFLVVSFCSHIRVWTRDFANSEYVSAPKGVRAHAYIGLGNVRTHKSIWMSRLGVASARTRARDKPDLDPRPHAHKSARTSPTRIPPLGGPRWREDVSFLFICTYHWTELSLLMWDSLFLFCLNSIQLLLPPNLSTCFTIKFRLNSSSFRKIPTKKFRMKKFVRRFP